MRLFDYTRDKIRLDRGRMWYSVFQSAITALLVVIFSSNVNWKYKVLGAILSFIFIYILGTVDDWLKLLDKEQRGYTKRNDISMEMLDILRDVKRKLL